MSTNSKSNSRKYSPITRGFILFLVYEVITIGVAMGFGLLVTNPSENLINFMRFSMFVIYFLAISLLQRYVDRKPFSLLRLRINGNAVKGFAISLILTGILVLVGRLMAEALFDSYLENPSHTSWNEMFSAFMAAFLLQGFPEEMAFRGYLSQTLEKRPLPTLIISSLFFTALHWHHLLNFRGIENLFEMLYPFAFGSLAFVLLFLFKTTWAAVAVHGGIHIWGTISDIIGIKTGSYFSFTVSVLMLVTTIILIFINREKFINGDESWPIEKSTL